MDKKYYLLILLGLGLLTRFMFFGHPNETVFDEVHFGKFISGYYTREYFFDIHPPLGKLIIAGFAKLFDFQTGFAFSDIGNEFPDKQYQILRFLPNLAGALLPVVIFLLLLEIGLARVPSFFGGLFIVLENALLTQSHYILLDSFLLLFGFLALLFYFKFKNAVLPAYRTGRHTTYYILLFGFFSGLALSVKWTGLGFLGLPFLFESIKALKQKNIKTLPNLLVPPLAIVVLVYFSIFSLHLIILNKTGPGDPFMSIGFQKTLAGSTYAEDKAQPSNLFQKMIELNTEMYKANQRLESTHPYSSQWYTWPFMTRSIYYWVNGESRIYLIGNPIIWWTSTATILYLAFNALYSIFQKKTTYYILHTTSYFLLAGYIVNILPFIGVKRVMFLYHYFIAYIFAIMIMVWLISQNKNSKKIFGVLAVASVIAFIYFAPLTYGLELSDKAYESRVWLESWK